MIQKKIVKQSHGSYQYITTEMRKKVIDLVLNLKMSIKDVNTFKLFIKYRLQVVLESIHKLLKISS